MHLGRCITFRGCFPESWTLVSQVSSVQNESMGYGQHVKRCWFPFLLQMTILFSPAKGYYCGTVVNNDVELSYYHTAGQSRKHAVGNLTKFSPIDLTGAVKTARQDMDTLCYAEVVINGTKYWSKLHEQGCAFLAIPTSYNHERCSNLECELESSLQGLVVPFISDRDWFIYTHDC
jgi:hypothetical protein